MRARRFALFLPLAAFSIAPRAVVAQTAAGAEALARGDAAWARRAEGHQGGCAEAGQVGEAVAAYEAAVNADPDDLDGWWKLLRAYHFQGEYVARTREVKQAAFGRGRVVA